MVGVTGYVGDFTASLRTTPRGVNADLVDIDAAIAACPVEVPNEFDDGLSRRRAIHRPYPDSVPNLSCDRLGRVHPLRRLCQGCRRPGDRPR